jgi:hypothetical protein
MTIFLDILGSWIVRGSLLIVMITLTINLNNAVYVSSQSANASAYVAIVDSIIYADVNAAGYCPACSVSTPFLAAYDSAITVLGDINNGGIPDTVSYYMIRDNVTHLYKLYRSVNNVDNGKSMQIANNLTSLNFKYYDRNGNQVTSSLYWNNIRSVNVTVVGTVENMTNGSSTVTSSFKIYPPNLL